MGVIVGLLVYFLPIYAAEPRPSLGGGGDRTPGIVLARYRQAQFDAAADDRPPPRPSASALPPASAHVSFVPELANAACDGDGRDLASHPGSPGSSRSPPVV